MQDQLCCRAPQMRETGGWRREGKREGMRQGVRETGVGTGQREVVGLRKGMAEPRCPCQQLLTRHMARDLWQGREGGAAQRESK
eukprot:450922-Pelagomonas_calceolata.AAC.1